jgi:hypothetical protein
VTGNRPEHPERRSAKRLEGRSRALLSALSLVALSFGALRIAAGSVVGGSILVVSGGIAGVLAVTGKSLSALLGVSPRTYLTVLGGLFGAAAVLLFALGIVVLSGTAEGRVLVGALCISGAASVLVIGIGLVLIGRREDG